MMLSKASLAVDGYYRVAFFLKADHTWIPGLERREENQGKGEGREGKIHRKVEQK